MNKAFKAAAIQTKKKLEPMKKVMFEKFMGNRREMAKIYSIQYDQDWGPVIVGLFLSREAAEQIANKERQALYEGEEKRKGVLYIKEYDEGWTGQ